MTTWFNRVQEAITPHKTLAPPSVFDRHRWLSSCRPESILIKGRTYQILKRMFDLALIGLTFPFWAGLMIIIGLLILIENCHGPVIFTQERTGKGGRRFLMYKFRTMVVDAEEKKQELMHLNELQWPDFKITNDPRITKIGRILRKSSLDELPQIFNVIKGEMSLVGPRPTSFSAENYRLWQTERLDVIPGITGLWQLLGRGNTEFDERLRMDILYIERQSLCLDLRILIMTVLAVVQGRGAK